MIKKLFNELLECVYPGSLYCICCGKIIDESRPYGLCNECMDSMKWAVGRCCSRCGKPLSENNATDSCFSCREHFHAYDRAFTCTEYGADERRIVFALKYDSRPDIAGNIGEIMADRLRSLMPATELAEMCGLLVPVPISRERLLKRGYNQSALICRSLAKQLDVPYEGEILWRTRDTSAMKGLTPDERRENIRGSFSVRSSAVGKVRGANCLIVDDIYTTGATSDELAVVLRDGGAEKVNIISFAAGADVVKS